MARRPPLAGLGAWQQTESSSEAWQSGGLPPDEDRNVTTTTSSHAYSPSFGGLDRMSPCTWPGRKTPHDEVRAFLGSLGGTVEYYSDTDQQALGYACSDAIGWDTIPRRNLALLEALASDAELFVTIDDDNIPLGTSYFDDLRELFQTTRPALVASSDAGWFNPGEFLSPPIFVRGFPHELRERNFPLYLRARGGYSGRYRDRDDPR